MDYVVSFEVALEDRLQDWGQKCDLQLHQKWVWSKTKVNLKMNVLGTGTNFPDFFRVFCLEKCKNLSHTLPNGMGKFATFLDILIAKMVNVLVLTKQNTILSSHMLVTMIQKMIRISIM